MANRIAKVGEKLEIKVDKMNLGAISILADGYLISVPCLDETMAGMSLDWWMDKQARQKADADQDAASKAPAREEARNASLGASAAIANSANVNMKCKTPTEIARLALEMGFGKGAHEKPFVGRDEYIDPILSGNSIGQEAGRSSKLVSEEDQSVKQASEQQAGLENPLSRYRAESRARASSRGNKGNEQ